MTKVFILAGQSNMAGAGKTAELPPAFSTPPDGVRLFEDGTWRNLIWQGSFGPEVGFSKAIAAAFPHDQIVLCKVAKGGANLCYDWNPDGVSQGPEDKYRGPLYPKLTAALDTLSQSLASTGAAADICGLLWMQGERDAVFDFMAQTYEQNLAAFIATIRRDTGKPALPCSLGLIAPRMYRLPEARFQHAFRHIVQEAQRSVARSDPAVDLVETRDLPQSDNLHFDTGGQIELGRRFAESYLRIAGTPAPFQRTSGDDA